MRFKVEETKDYITLYDNDKEIHYRNLKSDYSSERTYHDNGELKTYKNSNGLEITYYDNGNIKTYKNSDGLESTYDINGYILTRIKNGVMVIDKRPKKVTIELTQEQLDKIKEHGLL